MEYQQKKNSVLYILKWETNYDWKQNMLLHFLTNMILIWICDMCVVVQNLVLLSSDFMIENYLPTIHWW